MYKYYLLIVLGIVCVFLIPISFYNFIRKKEANEKMNKFLELAQGGMLTLDVVDVLPRLLIGMDTSSLKLMLMEGLRGNVVRTIDLQAVISCKMIVERSNNSKAIRLISLELDPRSRPVDRILFYRRFGWDYWNAKHPLKAAKKWEGIISGVLDSGQGPLPAPRQKVDVSGLARIEKEKNNY